MPKTHAQMDQDIQEYLSSAESAHAAQMEQEIQEHLTPGEAAHAAPPALGQLLGKTASGKLVHAPRRSGAPDTNDVLVFRKTKAKFPGWTKGDHMDAARLLGTAAQAAEAAGSRGLASTFSRWASTHWDVGGRWTSPEFDARFASLTEE